MAIYSKNGNSPEPLPFRIRLSDGRTRTDPLTFTVDEIVDAGYVEVVDPPTADYPNRVDWLPGTLEWHVRAPNENDVALQWINIRQECVKRLTDTDYKVIKAVEAGVAVDPAVVTYRQQIRDIYNNVNAIDPWFVVWPVLTTSEE